MIKTVERLLQNQGVAPPLASRGLSWRTAPAPAPARAGAVVPQTAGRVWRHIGLLLLCPGLLLGLTSTVVAQAAFTVSATFDSATAEVTEGADNAISLGVTLTPSKVPTNKELVDAGSFTLSYTVQGIEAMLSSDYLDLGEGSISVSAAVFADIFDTSPLNTYADDQDACIAPCTGSFRLLLQLVDDGLYEERETFSVTLSASSDIALSLASGAIGMVTVTITDDDSLAPRVESLVGLDGVPLFVGQAVTLTFNFDVPVTGFGVDDITLRPGGAVDNLVGMAGDSTYMLDITLMQIGKIVTLTLNADAVTRVDGTAGLSIAELPGNRAQEFTSSEFTSSGPGLVLAIGETTSVPIDSLAAYTETLTFRLRTDLNTVLAVTGLEESELVIVGGTLSAGSLACVEGTSAACTRYIFAITPTSGASVSIAIAADAVSLVSDATLGNAEAVLVKRGIASGSALKVEITNADRLYDGLSTVVTIAFRDPLNNSPVIVDSFGVEDITVTNATLANLIYNRDSTFSVAVTPLGLDMVRLEIAAGVATETAVDARTNEAGSIEWPVGGAALRIGITGDETFDSSVDAFFAGQPTVVDITFRDSARGTPTVVSGFDVGDIAVTNAALANFVNNGDGTFSVAVTPDSAGTVSLRIAADVATETAAVARKNLMVEAQWEAAARPSTLDVEISSIGELTEGLPATVAIEFRDSAGGTPVVVSGFDAGDIAVTNAALANFIDNGDGTFAVTVTPDSPGLVSLEIAAAVATETAAAARQNPMAVMQWQAATSYNADRLEVLITGFSNIPVGPHSGTQIRFVEPGSDKGVDVTGFEASDEESDVVLAYSPVGGMGERSPLFTISKEDTDPADVYWSLSITSGLSEADGAVLVLSIGENVVREATARFGRVARPNARGLVYSVVGTGSVVTASFSALNNLVVGTEKSVTLTFSETVSGATLTAGDIVVLNAVADFPPGDFPPNVEGMPDTSPDKMAYTFNITPRSLGRVRLELPAYAVTTADGDVITAAVVEGQAVDADGTTVAFDTAPPTLVITALDAMDAVQTEFGTGETVTLVFEFSEDVVGFTKAEIAIQRLADLLPGLPGATPAASTYTSGELVPISTREYRMIVTFNTGSPTLVIVSTDVAYEAHHASREALGNAAASLDLLITSPPVANAGADQDVAEGETVTLAGSGSDADGDAISGYSWRQLSGPTVALSATDVAGPTFTAPFVTAETELVFELIVTAGGMDSPIIDSVTITVANALQVRPIESVTATPNGATALDMAWIQGTDEDRDPTTGFDVQYRLISEPDTSYTTVAHSGSNAGVAIVGLTAETAYVVRVRARAGSGANEVLSDWVLSNPVITPSPVAQGMPTIIGTPTMTTTNASGTHAKVGDMITLEFSVSETLSAAPSVTLAGISATLVSTGNTYSATVAVAGATPEGAVDYEIGVLTASVGGITSPNPVMTGTSDIVVDRTVPTATIAHGGGTVASEAFTATITFSEPVTGFVSGFLGHVHVSQGTTSDFSSSDGMTHTLTITPPANMSGTLTIDVDADVAVDAAGNSNTAAAQMSVLFDTARPTVMVTHDGGAIVNEEFTATFVFSEPVTGLTFNDLTISGRTSDLRGSDATYMITITPPPAMAGSLTISVPANVAMDAAGNGNTSLMLEVPFDTVSPTVEITHDGGEPASDAFTATFVFSEPVDGFALGDVIVSMGTPSAFSGSGTTYTLSITPTTGMSGTLTIDVAANMATDAVGNGNAAASQLSVMFEVDTTKPTVEITHDAGAVAGGETSIVTVTFSEPVTGFELSNVSVSAGTASAFRGSADDTTYALTITLPVDMSGTLTIDVAADVAMDASGNSNAAAQASVPFDTIHPTVAIMRDGGNPVNGVFTATFVFSERVDGFALGDVRVSAGTASGLSDGPSSYMLTITPPVAMSGTLTIDVAADVATDTAGNGNTVAPQLIVSFNTIDTTSPTVEITREGGARVNETGNFTATVTFSEPVTGFTLSDVRVSTGTTTSNFSGSGATYTLTITPPANMDDALTIDVAANVAMDAAGNSNIAAPQLSVQFNTDEPRVEITHNGGAIVGGPFTATVTFSEPVTGFVLSDVRVSMGTTSNFSGNGATYTLTITPPDNMAGDITIDVVPDAAMDTIGNYNGAAPQLIVPFDTVVRPKVVVTHNGGAIVGGPFTATVTFSEPVNGFDLSDVSVSTGTPSDFSGNGATYTLTITPPVNMAGTIMIEVTANVATDTDGNGNSAASQVSVPFDTRDTTRPAVTITHDGGEVATASFTATFSFSKPVAGFSLSDVRVSGGGSSDLRGSDATYMLAIALPANRVGTLTIDVDAGVAMDADGNGNPAALQVRVPFDTAHPTVEITHSGGASANAAFIATVTFSEPVAGFSLADVSVSPGESSDLRGSGTTYRMTITPPDNMTGDLTINVAAGGARDAAGNSNIAAPRVSVPFDTTVAEGATMADTTPPTIEIMHNVNGVANSVFTVTFVFSEPVTGFGFGDVRFSGPVVPLVAPSHESRFSGSGAIYTARIFPIIGGEGTLTINVDADAAMDAAGNGNAVTSQVRVQIDRIRPRVSFSPVNEPVRGPFSLTLSFSERVIGFDVGDVVVPAGFRKIGFNVADSSGSLYELTIVPRAERFGRETISVTGSVTDVAGNHPGSTGVFLTLEYDTRDTTEPTVAITREGGGSASGPFTATVTFSEPVIGFTLDDVRVSTGTSTGGFSASASGTTYMLTITPPPSMSGDLTIDVDAGMARDAVGNTNTAASQASVPFNTIDTTSPTVEIAHNGGAIARAAFTATVTFSEPVTGFDINDVSVSTGTTTGGFSGDGATYMLAITPPANMTDTLTIDVAVAVAMDAASNDNTAASQVSVPFDTVQPTVAITHGGGTSANAAFTATITFSEPVTRFTLDDVRVSAGTTGGFSGRGTTYRLTITPPPSMSGDIMIDVAADVATDTANNGNIVAPQESVPFDTTGTDTTEPTVAITHDGGASAGGAFIATVSFSEPVTGFDINDVSVSSGTTGGFSGNGATYTLTIMPPANTTGTLMIDVAARVVMDTAGNSNTAALQVIVTFDTTVADTTEPTVEITHGGGVIAGEAFTTTVIFSEPVTGFVLDDVRASAGTASGFGGGGRLYTLTIMPPAGMAGALTIDVDAGVAMDAAGNSNIAAQQVSVPVDNISPTVAITHEGGASASEPFPATVTFSEPVNGFVLSDVRVSSGTRTGGFSGSGTTYRLTVMPPSSPTGTLMIDVDAGVAMDTAGNSNIAAQQVSVPFDNVSPTVEITHNADASASGPFTATITFSESVDEFDLSDVSVSMGTSSNFSGSGMTYTLTITPPDNMTGDITINVAARVAMDVAGNSNTAASQVSVPFDTTDTTPPTVAITHGVGTIASGLFTATVTFSEPVTGFDLSDVRVSPGTPSNFSGGGATYMLTITPPPNMTGTLTLDVAANVAMDDAGNGNTVAPQAIVPFDDVSPTVAITHGVGASASGPFTATVTFSESVDGFDINDVRVSVGSSTGGFSGGGTTYTLTITPPTSMSGTLTLDVAAGVAMDAAGNSNTVAPQVIVPFDTTDTTPPTVAITHGVGTIASGLFTATVTFSEPVTGFDLSDVRVSPGTPSNFSGGGATYMLTITPPPNMTGTLTLDVAANVAMDDAGNGNTVAPQVIVPFDDVSPTVAITHGVGASASGPFTATVTFSESVDGFDINDVRVSVGSSTGGFSGGGTTYTLTITPPTSMSGTLTLDVAAGVAMDTAGNSNIAAQQVSVLFDTTVADTTEPTVLITHDGGASASGPFTATVTFSESVTGFDQNDVRVSVGSSTGGFSGGGTTYTLTITPPPNMTGNITINVAAGVAMDASSNGNTVALQVSVLFDTTVADTTEPTVLITHDGGASASGPFTATVTFSESVTGFDLNDVRVSVGSSTGGFSGGGATYMLTITPPPNMTGTLMIDVDAGVAMDASSNSNIAAQQVSVLFDTTVADTTEPTVLITHDGGASASGPFTATVTFSESVTGFDLNDVRVSVGSSTGGFSGGGATYTLTITPPTSMSGTLTLDVAAGVAMDTAGNSNIAAQQVSVLFDTTVADTTEPTVLITHDGGASASGPFTATVTFSESVTGFDQNDVRVSPGTPSNFSGGGATYMLTITPPPNMTGTLMIDVDAGVAMDASSNSNIAAQQVSVLFDTTVADTTEPTVLITHNAGASASGPFTATITFSESVTGFDLNDVRVSVGSSTGGFSGGGATYTLTITPPTSMSGTLTLDVAAGVAMDTAGNSNIAAQQVSVLFDTTVADTTEPTVLITHDGGASASGPFTATVTFSESVTGFDQNDVRVSPGTPSNFSGGGATYMLTITPPPNMTGTLMIDVDAGVAMDASSNSNIAAQQVSVLFDTTVADTTEPTVLITHNAGASASGPFTATITFSERVAGFVLSDVSVSPGISSNFSRIRSFVSTYTLTITPPPNMTGDITINVAARVAMDASGNSNTAALQVRVAFDTTTTTPETPEPTPLTPQSTEEMKGSLGSLGRALAQGVSSVVQGRFHAGPAAESFSEASLLDVWSVHPGTQGTLDLEQLLRGTEFAYALGAVGEDTPLTFWGSGEWRKLSGDGGQQLDYDGDNYGVYVGVDALVEDTLLGLAMGYNRGSLDNTLGTEADGHFMTLHPYMSVEVSPGVNLWGTFGYGRGEVEFSTGQNAAVQSDDATLWTGTVGVERALQSVGAGDVVLSAAASVAQTEAGAVETQTYWLRAEAETGYRTEWGGGHARPYLLGAVRHDAGDAGTGTAFEVGGGLELHGARGLDVELRGRVQVNSTDNEVHSVGGSLRYDRGRDGRGLRFSLSPALGATSQPGLDTLQSVGVASGASRGASLRSELGYGMGARGGLWNPFGRMELQGGSQRWSTGLLLQWRPGVEFELEAERRHAGESVGHGALFNARLRF